MANICFRTREIKNANFGFTIGAPPLPAKKSTGHSSTPQPLPTRLSSRKTPRAQQTSSRKTPTQRGTDVKAATTRERRSTSAPGTGNGKPSRVGNAAPEPFQTPTVIGKRKRGARKTSQEQEGDELEDDDEGHRTAGKKTFVSPVARSNPDAQVGSAEQLPRIEEGIDELEEADADHTISSNGKNAQSTSLVLLPASRSTPLHAATSPLTPIALVQQASQPSQITNSFIDPCIVADQKSPAKLSAKDTKINGKSSSAITSTGRTTYLRTSLTAVANMLPLPSASIDPSTPRSSSRIINSISPLFEPDERPDAEGSPPAISSNVDPEGETDEDLTSVTQAEPSTKVTTPRRSTNKKIRKEAQMSAQKTPKRKVTSRLLPNRFMKSRKSPSDSKLHVNNESRPKKTSERITVPITIYKPTDLEKLYTYSSAPPDADPLGADPIPSLNPVDVLAQITTEITTQFIHGYDNDGEGNVWGSDGLRRRQKAAVSKFHRCLQDSLFALTASASTVTALGSRVRKVKKRRLILREELVQLRREKEEVGIEMDRVRAVYRRAKEVDEERAELNQGLFDIESAVLRGRERARALGRNDESPDLGIVEMRDRVMGGIGENGLLSTVRDMNAQLEHATLVFEGRV